MVMGVPIALSPPPFIQPLLCFAIYLCSLSLHPFEFSSPVPTTQPPLSSLPPYTNMPESKKKGEVMWPRLVANKLLRRPLGSNNFVADFPASELLEDPAGSDYTQRRYDNPKDTQKYKLFASTWNVGGVTPSDEVNLEEWLDTENDSYDIYVLGFQEIVPLSAKNVLGPEKSRTSMKWNSLIRATLNKSLSNSKEPKVADKQKVYPIKYGSSHDYRCIVSKQMVGILVCVWVRGDLLRYIRHPSVSCVGCGIMGCLGNKGSVSVRFFLHETSFCFVCCHLASGGKEGDEMHRNSNAMEIFSRTSFPRYRDLPRKILDHDRIILLGDLNYRISLPEAETRCLVEQKEWSILLEKDQLRGEVSEGRAFQGWQEGMIAFSPTYKYYPNSDEYYGWLQGRKGEKRRTPAWCDRILWHGVGLKQTRYDRYESRLSDHRPVRAVFKVEVEALRNANSLRSFFLSDRFDRISSHLELLAGDYDHLSCSNRRASVHVQGRACRCGKESLY